MALADYGPIEGHRVSMGAGLDSLCTAEGGAGEHLNTFFVRGGPRRGTENILTPFDPRRAAKGHEDRAIANLKFSATFTYLMEELGKIQTPSR